MARRLQQVGRAILMRRGFPARLRGSADNRFGSLRMPPVARGMVRRPKSEGPCCELSPTSWPPANRVRTSSPPQVFSRLDRSGRGVGDAVVEACRACLCRSISCCGCYVDSCGMRLMPIPLCAPSSIGRPMYCRNPHWSDKAVAEWAFMWISLSVAQSHTLRWVGQGALGETASPKHLVV